MANYIFNWALTALTANTLDLSTGDYYAHLVTSIPAISSTVVSSLTIPTSSGYTSTPLTGLSYNSTRWTFNTFSFPKYSFASIPTGVVICKRLSAVPSINDQVICYSDFNNSIGQAINLQVGGYVVNLQFGSNGAINFSYRYQYSSGAYINTETIPKGLIYLIGSKNNTVTFADPTPSKMVATGNSISITNRSTAGGTSGTSRTILMDFGSLVIKPTTIGIFSSGAATWTVATSVSSDNISYTPIGSESVVFNFNFKLVTVSTSSYWKYLRITGNGTGGSLCDFVEIEFYNSSILSPTLNII
jgi:hypothetical protein